MTDAGRLVEADEDRWSVTGLEGVALGERLRTEGGDAIAVALLREHVVALPVRGHPPQVGAAVHRAGPLTLPVGEALLGRVVDPMGEALDGGPDPRGTPWAIGDAPRGRLALGPQLPTGLLVLDLARRVTRGAAHLVRGADTASRSVLVDRIASFRLKEGDVVVLASLDGTVERLERLRLDAGATDGIGVSAPRDAPAGMRALLPFAAATVAGALREAGRDVLLVVDPLPNDPCELWRVWRGSPPATDARRLMGVVGAAPRGGSVTVLATEPGGESMNAAVAEACDATLRADHALAGEPALPPTKHLPLPARVDDVGSIAGPIAVALLYAQRADERGEAQSEPSSIVQRGRALRLALRPDPAGAPDPIAQLCALTALVQVSLGAHPEWLVYRLRRALAEHERQLVRAVAEQGHLDRATQERLGALAAKLAAEPPAWRPPTEPLNGTAPHDVAELARRAGPLARDHFRVVTVSGLGVGPTHRDHATLLEARAHADDAASEADFPFAAAYVFDHHRRLVWRGRHYGAR